MRQKVEQVDCVCLKKQTIVTNPVMHVFCLKRITVRVTGKFHQEISAKLLLENKTNHITKLVKHNLTKRRKENKRKRNKGKCAEGRVEKSGRAWGGVC